MVSIFEICDDGFGGSVSLFWIILDLFVEADVGAMAVTVTTRSSEPRKRPHSRCHYWCWGSSEEEMKRTMYDNKQSFPP